MTDVDFDFDECVGIANRPVKDLSGFVKGKVTSITVRTVDFKKPRSRNDFEDDIVQKVFMFTFMMESKTEPIKMTKMTGTKINTEIKHVKAKGRGSKEQPEYNALTEMCLKLGIFKQDDVVDEKHELLLEKLKKAVQSVSDKSPIYVKTKLETSEKSAEFENINVRTIQLIDKF